MVLRMSERRWLVCERALAAQYSRVVGETGDLEGATEVVLALGQTWKGENWHLIMVSERQWIIGRMSSQHVTPLVTCKTKYTAERVFEAMRKKG